MALQILINLISAIVRVAVRLTAQNVVEMVTDPNFANCVELPRYGTLLFHKLGCVLMESPCLFTRKFCVG